MAKKKHIAAHKTGPEGFRYKFGEGREGLPPTTSGWRPVPEFKYYAYTWWYNEQTQRFAVSANGWWAIAINKDLHTYLTTKIQKEADQWNGERPAGTVTTTPTIDPPTG